MKTSTIAIAAAVLIVGASITLAVTRWLGADAEIAFVVGAVLATQVAAFVHFGTPGSVNSVKVKLVLGTVLAVAALLFGLLINALYSPFRFADVSIPIATIGTFGTPFVLFGQMWNVLFRSKRW